MHREARTRCQAELTSRRLKLVARRAVQPRISGFSFENFHNWDPIRDFQRESLPKFAVETPRNWRTHRFQVPVIHQPGSNAVEMNCHLPQDACFALGITILEWPICHGLELLRAMPDLPLI